MFAGRKRGRLRQAAFAALFLVAFIGAVGARMMYREAQVAAAMSTVSSVYVHASQLEDALPAGRDWRVLGGDEYRQVVERLRERPVDTGRSGWTDQSIVDPWNQRLQIAVRNGTPVDVVVWSNGPDGLPATADDLFASSEARNVRQGPVQFPAITDAHSE